MSNPNRVTIYSPKPSSTNSISSNIFCSYCKNLRHISAKCSRFHFICVDCHKIFNFSYCLLCHASLDEFIAQDMSLEDLLHPPVIQTYPQPSSLCSPMPKVPPTIKKCTSKEDDSSLYETCSRNFFLLLWDSLSSISLQFGKKIIRKREKASTAVIITGLLAKLGKTMAKPLYKSLKRKCGLSGPLKLGLLLAILVIGIHEFTIYNHTPDSSDK